jgi:hypothetical protein
MRRVRCELFRDIRAMKMRVFWGIVRLDKRLDFVNIFNLNLQYVYLHGNTIKIHIVS